MSTTTNCSSSLHTRTSPSTHAALHHLLLTCPTLTLSRSPLQSGREGAGYVKQKAEDAVGSAEAKAKVGRAG